MRLLFCLLMLGVALYGQIEKQNQVTAIRIRIPQLFCELRALQEKSILLMYEIEQFESPENLLRLASQDAFYHLKYPLQKEVLALQAGVPLRRIPPTPTAEMAHPLTAVITVFTGGHIAERL